MTTAPLAPAVGRTLRERGGVHASAALVVDAAGRLTTLRSSGPLQLRPGHRTSPLVRLVTGAGGPLVGDHWRLDVEVAAGGSLTLRAVAASVALPARAGRAVGGWSCTEIHACVGTGGRLDVDLGPTVVADGARHRLVVVVELDDGADLRWSEELVRGRHGERGGVLVSRLDVLVGRRPLLRQELALEPGGPRSGPAVLGGARVVATELVAGPSAAPGSTVAQHPDAPAVRLPLAGPGWQATALADDVPTARRRLAAVLPAAA